MIKSFLLNNLLVPLQLLSPSMLLASATLHGFLFLIPIPSNSPNADAKTKDTQTLSEAGIQEGVFNENGSLIEPGAADSLNPGGTIQVPGTPPLLEGLKDGTNDGNLGDGSNTITPDLSLNESGSNLSLSEPSLNESGGNLSLSEPSLNESSGSINETPPTNFSPDSNLSLNEPQPQIPFTPSQPINEPTVTVSEPVVEPTDTISQPVVEPADTESESEVAQPDTNTTTKSNPEKTTPETNNQTPPVNPFANFPNYLSVRPNFCGIKSARIDRRTKLTSDPLDSVQAYFEKKLAGTDFQVEKLTDRPDTKVYQVSKGNLTQFLQLFADEEKGTMILLSSQRVDCYRLSNDRLEKANPETEEQTFDATLQNLYVQLGWMEEKDFAATSEVEKIFGKDTNNTPEKLALLVKSKLESEGFETSQVNEETSGLLYEVKKGEFTKYISFVPIKEGKGAIIITLKNSP